MPSDNPLLNKPLKNNHEVKTSSGVSKKKSAPQLLGSATSKTEQAELESLLDCNFISFRKGMKSKEVRMNLFLLEGMVGFNRYDLRERMTLTMRYADKEVKE